MNGTIFYFLLVCVLISCTTANRKEEMTRVSVNVYAAQNDILYLKKIPYGGEQLMIVDSAVVKSVKNSIIFNLPKAEDRIYMLEVKNSLKKFYFIPDASYIHVYANNVNGTYIISGSAVSISLKTFTDTQQKIVSHAQKIQRRMDSLRRTKPVPRGSIEVLEKQWRDTFNVLNEHYFNYADTVNNFAAFMMIYDKIDFGNDHGKQKKFIVNAGQRFGKYKQMQYLEQDVLEMVDIYEKEYYVGDTLPTFSLPDFSGNNFSTGSLKGKYYLIDFWSTWCPQCLAFNKFKKEAKATFPADKFEIVSVALDDNKAGWQNIVLRNNYNWKQLIDEKMWQGTAVRTLKFDSIPFNFLVSPQGRIIAKAIQPDSLLQVLHEKIK